MTRISAALIVVLALALGACGVRGPLEPPESAPPNNDPFVLDPLI
jgi:predicted small lipoprotein YifL